MRKTTILSFVSKVCFWLWFFSLFLIIVCLFLSKDLNLFLRDKVVITLIQINSITGSLSIFFFLAYIFFAYFLKLVLKKSFLILVIASLIVFLVYKKGWFFRYKPAVFFSNMDYSLATIPQFYSSLFMDVFGYPADSRMATGDELFQAVNNYRLSRQLPELIKEEALCELAQKSMSELMSVAVARRYEFVDEHVIVKDNKEVTEIIEAIDQPNLSKNIVEARWLRPVSKQRKILNDPQWKTGCSAVSGYNIVFVFGQ